MIFPLRCKIIIKNFPHALAENDICRFRDFLKSEEKEPATIEKYVKEIKSFCEWLCGRPVTKEAVIEWKERLQKQEYVPVTVNGKLSALNGFFSFMGWTEIRVKFLRIQRRMFRERSKEQSP